MYYGIVDVVLIMVTEAVADSPLRSVAVMLWLPFSAFCGIVNIAVKEPELPDLAVVVVELLSNVTVIVSFESNPEPLITIEFPGLTELGVAVSNGLIL